MPCHLFPLLSRRNARRDVARHRHRHNSANCSTRYSPAACNWLRPRYRDLRTAVCRLRRARNSGFRSGDCRRNRRGKRNAGSFPTGRHRCRARRSAALPRRRSGRRYSRTASSPRSCARRRRRSPRSRLKLRSSGPDSRAPDRSAFRRGRRTESIRYSPDERSRRVAGAAVLLRQNEFRPGHHIHRKSCSRRSVHNSRPALRTVRRGQPEDHSRSGGWQADSRGWGQISCLW